MDLSTPSPPTTDPTTPPPTPEELLESQMKAWRKVHHEALVLDSRMSIPYGARLPLCTSISFLCGMALGISHGSQAASLRFRAENAHRLPTSPTGWYLYHKNRFPIITAARTARTGLAFGIGYGLLQDAVGYARGRRLGYIDFLTGGTAGRRGKEEEEGEEDPSPKDVETTPI
ncbi:hypothetical protein H4I96_01991 [Botrytis cinerea]